MVCPSGATHQMVVHLEQHTTNKLSRCDCASVNRRFLVDCILAEETGFIYIFSSRSLPLSTEAIRDRHPDLPLTSPYTSRSSRISALSGTPGTPSEGGMAFSGSSRTLGSPCMNAFSPSPKVPSEAVDARICSVTLASCSCARSIGCRDP